MKTINKILIVIIVGLVVFFSGPPVLSFTCEVRGIYDETCPRISGIGGFNIWPTSFAPWPNALQNCDEICPDTNNVGNITKEFTNNAMERNPVVSQIVDSNTKQSEIIPSYTNELYEYALELVNKDRTAHGLTTVKLSSLKSAQAHADDLLEHDYFSHWNSDGEKPYVYYTKLGGKGEVVENIATTESFCPTGNCLPNVWEPKAEIKQHQHDMMYNDASSDWGHRDAILDPHHTHVNFGISWDDGDIFFVQHFEKNLITWNKVTISEDNILILDGDIVSGYVLRDFYIYEDPESTKLSGVELDTIEPYSWGYYDQGKLSGTIVKPLGPLVFYQECPNGKLATVNEFGVDNCVDYEIFQEYEKTTEHFFVQADISKWIEQDGLHTLYIFVRSLDSFEDFPAVSVTLEHLKGK